MKKIYLALLFVISMLHLSHAGDTSDFGWSSTLETNWGTMRDTPHAAYTTMKSKVDNNLLRSRYDGLAGADLMWRITGDTAYLDKEYALWVTSNPPLCGMAPLDVVGNISTNFISTTGGTTKIIMQENSAIHFTATSMPNPLVSGNTYYAVNVNESAGKFQVSETSGGSAIDLNSTGSGVKLYFNDGVYYRPSGCKIQSYDELRAQFPSFLRSFAAIKDSLTASQRANMRDQADFIVSRITEYSNFNDWNSIPNRRGDTDQSSFHTISLLVYALLIAPEDATRKSYQMSSSQVYAASYGSDSIGDLPLGGLASTGSNTTTTWRNLLRYRFENLCDGGLWIEGSEYSPATAKGLLEFVEHIRDYTGVDYFPELTTACYETIAKTMINQLVPDLNDSAEWTDENNPHDIRYLNNIGWFSLMAYLGNKYGITSTLVSTLNYLTDLFDTAFGTSTHRQSYYDYRTATPRTFQMSGYSASNSTDRGINFFHKNWGGASDSLTALYHFNIGAEHDLESLTTIQGYRGDDWWIDNARGYPQSHEGTTYNTATIHGGVNFNGAGCDEVRGQNAYYTDSTTVYATGTEGGYQALCGQIFPPEESMHEHTRSFLDLHWANGAESIVVHDRIDADNPTTLARLANYQGNGVPSGRKTMILNEGYKHNFHIQVPEVSVTQVSDLYSWTADNGETVYLKTFMPSYTYQLATECKYGDSGCGFHGYDSGSGKIPLYGAVTASEQKKQIRLVDTDAFTQWRTWLNLLHVGSSITTATRFTNEGSGDDIDGLFLTVGSENAIIVFNATQGTEVPPSPLDSNGRVVSDSTKADKLYKKTQFNTMFEIRPPSGAAATLYVANLNPNKTWKMIYDGTTVNPITVDSSGLFKYTIPSYGSDHYIVISSISTCDSTFCDCDTQELCEAQTGCYYYDLGCHTTPEEVECSAQQLDACDQTECEELGLYYYSGACHLTPQAATCDGTAANCLLCTETQCLTYLGTCYFYNNVCTNTAPPSGTSTEITLTATADAYIQSGTFANTNFGSETIVIVKDSATDANKDRTGLYRFSLGTIPVGSTIIDVKFKPTVEYVQTYNKQSYLYKSLIPNWVENQVTWNNYKAGTPWGTDGARGNNADFSGNWQTPSGYLAFHSHLSVAVGDEITYETQPGFIQYIQDNIGNSVNFILHELQNQDSTIEYYSRESAYPPKLVITYIPPAPSGVRSSKILQGVGSFKGGSF